MIGEVQVEGAPQRGGRVRAANLGESGTCHKMEEIELVGARKRVVGVNERMSVGGPLMCPPRSTALRGGRGSPLCSLCPPLGAFVPEDSWKVVGVPPAPPSPCVPPATASLGRGGLEHQPREHKVWTWAWGGPDSSAVPKWEVARWSQNYAWSLSGFSLSGPLPWLGVPVCITPHPRHCPSTASTETPGPRPSHSLVRGLCRAVDGLRIQEPLSAPWAHAFQAWGLSRRAALCHLWAGPLGSTGPPPLPSQQVPTCSSFSVAPNESPHR